MSADDWKDGDPLRTGGAHSHGDLLSYEEALRLEMARREAWRQRPDVVDWLARRERAARAREAEKMAGKPQGFIGPPNPYKGHRRG